MNSRQRRILEAIYAQPTRSTISWTDMESLLRSIGCEVKEGKGSGVKFRRDGITLFVHRPHPEPVAKRYQVEDIREFLTKIGVEP